ncbi:hypothetical protein [Bradyrhizobium sp.]|uniref:hypothetical protein n=1 Tax=Bradyrhizobium sp. TaxID=376 RepID=UPI003C715878
MADADDVVRRVAIEAAAFSPNRLIQIHPNLTERSNVDNMTASRTTVSFHAVLPARVSGLMGVTHHGSTPVEWLIRTGFPAFSKGVFASFLGSHPA